MGRRRYGYARVSATDQNLDRQREALSGVDVLVEEKVSGKSRDGREKLKTLIEFADDGDVVRVKSIDRLARNTRDLLAIVDELAAKGVCVEFVDTPQLNVTTKEGRAMLTIFAAFAQLERESIRERQEVPAPILAELVGIADKTAMKWAALAARDWAGYISDRAR